MPWLIQSESSDVLVYLQTGPSPWTSSLFICEEQLRLDLWFSHETGHQNLFCEIPSFLQQQMFLEQEGTLMPCTRSLGPSGEKKRLVGYQKLTF